MTTDPGDLVFDPTCGSGTTAYVAEQWGRRWITCDTSRVALTLAKQRLMTAVFDYYELAHPEEGVGSGFRYKTVPHVTLKIIANNEPPAPRTLYDQPTRGPIPRSTASAARSPSRPCPRRRSSRWRRSAVRGSRRDRCPPTRPLPAPARRCGRANGATNCCAPGIRGKAGQHDPLRPAGAAARLPLAARRRRDPAQRRGADQVREGAAYEPQRVVVSFGPEHAPLEQRQVELALEEAQTWCPGPS